jgi:hypothetical protein
LIIVHTQPVAYIIKAGEDRRPTVATAERPLELLQLQPHPTEVNS